MSYGWVMFILFVVSTAYSIATRPKPQKPRALAFDDFEFPQFEEGTPQAVFFGDCTTESWMVAGLGNFRTSKVRTKSGK